MLFIGNQSIYLQNSLDEDFDKVVLLMKGENNNNSTTFTDSSSYARLQSAFAASVNTNTVVKFGSGSIYQTGTNQQVTYPTQTIWSGNALATSQWTLEAWLYLPNGLHGTYNSAELANPSGNRGNWSIFPTYVGIYNGNGSILGTLTASPAANTWHHVVVQKNSTANSTNTSTYDIYFNGVRRHINSVPTWLTGNTTQTWQMGRADGAARPGKYVDDYRFSIGVVRYPGSPSTITVPDREYGISKR